MSVQIQSAENTPAEDGAPAFVVEKADGSVQIDPAKLTEEQNKAKPVARPEGLPDGFESWADLARAFSELKAGKPAVAPVETPAQITTPADAAAAAKAAGVDLDALSREFAEKGELSAESLAALEAKGINRKTVDSYIEGQKAQASTFKTQLAEAVGGPEEMDALLAWAGSGLTAAEIASYNRMLSSSDLEVAKMALEGLAAKQEKLLGSSTRRLNGGSKPASGGVKEFASQAEALDAMSNPKYATDPAYAAKVDARLEISNVFSFAYA